jgi:anti-sigma B factor antagonist
MKIEFRDIGEHKVIQVSGDVILYNAGAFKKALFSITDGSYRSVIIDLKDIEYIDSSGIGILIAGLIKMSAHKGELALLRPHKNFLQILQYAMVKELFRIYWSEEDVIY